MAVTPKRNAKRTKPQKFPDHPFSVGKSGNLWFPDDRGSPETWCNLPLSKENAVAHRRYRRMRRKEV